MYDEALIQQIRPEMHLCSSDHRKWGVVDTVEWPESGEPVVAGRVDSDGRSVYVPSRAVIEIRGDKCVVFNVPLTEADAQGWEREPESLVSQSS